jgi:hypothetical protein
MKEPDLFTTAVFIGLSLLGFGYALYVIIANLIR